MNTRTNPACTNWSTKELLAARDELRRDYWEATHAGRLVIARTLVDIDAEIVARNLTPTDALQ